MGITLGHSQYSCYVADPFGTRLGDASAFISLKYSRVVNDIGTAIITLPVRGPKGFDTNLLRLPDGRLEIWRRLPGSSREYLDTETTWLMKKSIYERDDRGRTTVTIEADTPLCVLREPGRFHDYNAGDSLSTMGPAAVDDIIKAIARYNIGANALAARDLSAYITVANDTGQAATNSKSFAWRDVLKTMQELANASTQQGVYVAFDIISPTPDTMQFLTYIGQRGVDHRFPNGQNPIIIGPEFGNMGACTLSTDWRNEITYAKAGGRGEGADRLTEDAQDDERIGQSPFGRREKFVNATQYETTTGLQAEAEAVVRQGRPKQLFRGKILDVPDTRYGVHWAWGDFVTVQAFNQGFDARIDAIDVLIERGKETISAWIRADL